MDYRRQYTKLVERARGRKLEGYTERHHILPRCLGGTDDAANLVDLTPEEHFLAHVLLVKIHPGSNSLVFAVNKMCSPLPGGRPKRKLYGWLRRRFAEAMSAQQTGSGNNQFGTFWITNGIESMKLTKGDDIPEGWQKGRKIPQMVKADAKCRQVKLCTVCNAPTGKPRGRLCEVHLQESKMRNGLMVIRENRAKAYAGSIFITDGTIDKLHPADKVIPEGFRRGRCTNNNGKNNG